jgi:hypothetical protein
MTLPPMASGARRRREELRPPQPGGDRRPQRGDGVQLGQALDHACVAAERSKVKFTGLTQHLPVDPAV